MPFVRRCQGRPAVKDPKNQFVKFRTNTDDRRKIAFLKDKTGMTTTDILRRGIEMQYQIAKIQD